MEPCEVRVLLPHEILHTLATMPSTSVFNSVMLGNMCESARIGFWEHLRSLKPWASHPVLTGANYDPGKMVGFCIHGDGCQMFNEDELFVWSLSSIFGQEGIIGDVLLFKFPFVVVPEKFMRSSIVSCWNNYLGDFFPPSIGLFGLGLFDHSPQICIYASFK